jgi:hypothetical protein
MLAFQIELFVLSVMIIAPFGIEADDVHGVILL